MSLESIVIKGDKTNHSGALINDPKQDFVFIIDIQNNISAEIAVKNAILADHIIGQDPHVKKTLNEPQQDYISIDNKNIAVKGAKFSCGAIVNNPKQEFIKINT